MKILYITKNKFKLAHALQYTNGSGIEIEGYGADILEIQSPNIEEVVRHKAQAAWELLHKPLIVSDSGWEIPALNGFPGAYMHDVNSWFKPEDFLSLIGDKKDRSIILNHLIAVVLNGEIKVFIEQTHGVFAEEPRGEGSSLDQVVVMDGGSKTIAEIQNAGLVSADGKEIWDNIVAYIHQDTSNKLAQ